MKRLLGWARAAGWGLLGLAALGLPTALVVALLDHVRRGGTVTSQRVLVAGLVLLAVVLVVAAERGISYAAREIGVGTALAIAGGVLVLVLVGALWNPAGLVLVALGVVLGTPAALAGIGYLAWWRWQHGPRPPARVAPSVDQVRARAEERRAAVRARHERTREAVRRGYVGPGFTRGGGSVRPRHGLPAAEGVGGADVEGVPRAR